MLTDKSQAEIQTLMRVALGKEPADLVVRDANLVNVFSGEIVKSQSVAVKGRWVAYVGSKIEAMVGPDTEVIDARGRALIPGLIDGHTHVAFLYSASEFVRYAAAGGTTLIVTEALEPYPVAGIAGVIDFLKSFVDQPIKLLATAPAMVSISTAARGISERDLATLLKRPDILGMGEAYWQEVLRDPDIYVPAMARTLQAGKLLEGHTAGARDGKLNAYVAAGISSCHEPINAEQVLEGLRLGLHIMIREGSIRRDLEAICGIRNTGIDLRRLILVTDSISAGDLLDMGYMDHVVQKAIDCGFDPVAAIQMATLNPAEHFGLDHLIGGIGPGKLADIVIIPDERTIEAQVVISNGRIIARNGRLAVPVRDHRFKRASVNSVHLPKPMVADDFKIPASKRPGGLKVRIIDMVTDLVTRETHLDITADHGEINADPTAGLAKIAAIDRTRNPGACFVGLIRGFGLQKGALACSAAWDASDIVVIGCSDQDMAAAVNQIHALQGGAVVCADGSIIAQMPLPVFGILSTEKLETVARQTRSVQQAARALGVAFTDPILSLITLTGAAIPYLRICEEGLVNLKDGVPVGLFVEGSI